MVFVAHVALDLSTFNKGGQDVLKALRSHMYGQLQSIQLLCSHEPAKRNEWTHRNISQAKKQDLTHQPQDLHVEHV